MPGRTDNEIKNYWRTRIQKHIKQAENNFTGQSSNEQNHDQGSTSQMSTTSSSHHHHNHAGGGGGGDAVETYSPPSYQANFEAAFQNPFPTDQSTDNIWSMEDLWPMQLLSGD